MELFNIENIIQIIDSYSSLGVFFIVMLEYANVPLPSELVLPFVGILVSKGNLDFSYALLLSVLGGIIGSLINYGLGWYFGNPLIKYIFKKFPKTKESIKKSMYYIQKYDKISVLIARIIPIARTFISIPSGVTKMNIYSFTLYSTIGITLWNSFLITLGYLVGNNIHLISKLLTRYSIIISLLIILFIFYVFIKKNPLNKPK